MSKSQHNTLFAKNLITSPVFLGGVVCSVLLILTGVISHRVYTLTMLEERQEAQNVADGARHQLEASLQHGLSATQTLALLLEHSNIKSDFAVIGEKILSSYSTTIDAIELAPDGIVRYVYPFKENEPAIGFKILEHPVQRAEALQAIKERRLIFAGPLYLIQGGNGVVGRLPVFIKQNGKEIFWGFSIIIIKIETLLKSSSIDLLFDKGYAYRLSRILPETKQEEIFAGSESVLFDPVFIPVNVPNGEWILTVSPIYGWTAFNKIELLMVMGCLVSILGGVLTWMITRKPRELKFLVDQKTSELTAIFHALPDLYFRLSADGTIKDYRSGQPNSSLYLPPEMFLGKKLRDTLPHDVAEKLMNGLEQTFSTSSIATVEYSLLINGVLRMFEARFSPLTVREAIVVIRDITDRKIAEEELRLTQFSIEHAADSVYWMDAWGKFVYVNDTAARVLGYTKEELLSMNVFDIDPGLTNEKWQNLSERRRKEKTYVIERNHKTKEGTLIPMEISSNYVIFEEKEFACAFARNITERKKADELLRSSEEKFSKAFRISPDSININRLSDGLFVNINEGFTQITGYTPDDITGKTSPEINIWANYADRDRLRKELREHGEVTNLEAPFRMKNGEVRTGLMSARIIDVGGEPCILSITRDISERKKMEEEIQRMNEELELRVEQRTAELTALNIDLESFSYSVSHDLRAPLRAIDGYAFFLKEGNWQRLDDEGKENVKRIRSNIKKMDALINGLLNLSRIGRSEMNFSTVKMEPIVQRVCNELLPADSKENYSIQLHHLPNAVCDQVLLSQVWSNLISNAIKYSQSSGAPTIEISGETHTDHIIYSVKDNGVGFDMANSKHLFGIFQRLHTDKKFEGLGIGLSIVKRIIQRHGGEVWAESTPNEGATFYFSLPVQLN